MIEYRIALPRRTDGYVKTVHRGITVDGRIVPMCGTNVNVPTLRWHLLPRHTTANCKLCQRMKGPR